MKKIPYFLFVAILTCCMTSLAQPVIQDYHLETSSVKEYEKAEWTISLTARWNNPYLQKQIALDMLLTSPSGKKLTLPCYYEQGDSGKPSTWKAHFAPQEPGKYHYTFRLTEAMGKPVFSKAGTFKAKASKKKGFLHPFNNWALQFDNGAFFRGIGENIAWESRDQDDSKYFSALHENPKYNYDYMLPSLAKHGGNFYRTWMCSWNLPLDWHSHINNRRYTNSDAYYNPSAIKRIDHVINLSDSLGLYIMLTLGPGNYSIRDGGFSPSAADFFVNPKSKERYRDRLRYIIARWGYSTSIAFWELFNEVDNVQYGRRDNPISADSIVDWHREMSTYIKSIDPYQHMVTTSISHRDLKGLNSIEAIDLNQKHIYKNTTAIPSTIVSYEQKFGKPYTIGEYGYEWDWSKNFGDFAPEMDSDFKRGLWYGLFSPTPVLPMSWWWEYFDNRNTDAYISHVRKIADQMLQPGAENMQSIKASASDTALKVMGVKCGAKTFVYAYNPTDENKTADLHFELPEKFAQAKIYDCESATYHDAGPPAVNSDGGYQYQLSLKPLTDQILIVE